MIRKGAVWIGASFAAAWLWSAAASAIYLASIGFLSECRPPWLQWWVALHYAAKDGLSGWTALYVWFWLVVAGAAPTIAAYAVWARLRKTKRRLKPPVWRRIRPSERGVTDNHGHANWLSVEEMLRLFPGPTADGVGVVVGEAYRVDQQQGAGPRFLPYDAATWGQGGKAPLLIDPCREGPTHSISIAGSGASKTTSAVSTILTWGPSCIVHDPSCELGPMLKDTLEARGKRVFMLDPRNMHSGINALDWIDMSDPLAEVYIYNIVDWIGGEQAPPSKASDEKTEFFFQWAKDVVACLIADMLCHPAGVDKTLETVREAICRPEREMRDLLKVIHTNSHSRMARQLAGSLMQIVDQTFSGIYGEANRITSWLSTPALARLVSESSFRVRDILDGDVVVFIQIPPAGLSSKVTPARVILGCFLKMLYLADGNITGRVLFLLDEAAQLGRMQILEQARDLGRKYGITMQMLYQSVGQIEGQWGKDGKRAWYDGVSWRSYAAVQDEDTAKEVIAYLGSYGVMAYSEGDNRGTQANFGHLFGSRSSGWNVNVHEIKRPLAFLHEMLQDPRSDEQFVIPRSSPPIRCGRAIYYRRPELNRLVSQNRFANVKSTEGELVQ